MSSATIRENNIQPIQTTFNRLKVFHCYRKMHSLLLMLMISPMIHCTLQTTQKLSIDNLTPCHITDPKFLSFALDSSFLHRRMQNMTNEDWNAFVEIVKPLSPGYLRLGGTDADRLVFKNTQYKLTEKDWVKINKFAIKTNLTIIFDLNVMLRKGSQWDPSNALKMLRLTKNHGFKVHFQLGNEPNSFMHVFNYSISPHHLGHDFQTLRKILSSDDYFRKSLLIGPDVTRPKNLTAPALKYLRDFLNVSIQVIDAVSWHQYYVNGRTATVKQFLDYDVMNFLEKQILAVTNEVRSFSSQVPIWLSETGSAYGGGAPGLSDRFASVFLFLDKLGLSAKSGLSVVVRQSLFQGHYSLIDNAFRPNPDYWVSLLYKQIAGNQIFYCNDLEQTLPTIRYYVQSAQQSNCIKNPKLNSSLILFGMNLADAAYDFKLKSSYYQCAAYIFQSPDLHSTDTFLNGIKLEWNDVEPKTFAHDFASLKSNTVFPARSLVFWVISVLE